MKIKIDKFIYIVFAAALISSNCEDTTSSDNPVPGRVILIEKSAEDDSIETGIDAEFVIGSPQNGIFLQWREVDHEDLAGYRVYRSTVDTSTAFARIADVRKSVGKIDTFYTDTNVDVGTRYYYRVSAIDQEDQEGTRSRAANYELEEICTLYSPISTTQFDGNFHWQSPPTQFPTFVFRLLKERSFGIYEVVLVKEFPNDYHPEPIWSLSDFNLAPLQPGTYRWRIDVIGTEPNNGSESAWQGFQVQ